MKKVTTRHSFFSMSGILTRFLILSAKVAPPGADIAVAVAFGIVEMLGAKRFWKILGPAVKTQILAMGRKRNA